MERKGKFEELVVASNEIAASTAQLVCSHFHGLIFMFSFSSSYFIFMFSFQFLFSIDATYITFFVSNL